MIAVEKTVLVLLAAGRSERWGQIDSKLEEVFLGRPLGLHVAVALEDMPFKERIAVTGRAKLDFARHRFRVVASDQAEGTMAHSVHLGVAAAREQGADAVLIALADMPRITAAHIYRLFEATGRADTVVASSDGRDPCPPAIFGRERFDFLMNLQGAEGARELVRSGRHVVTSPAELIDIDTPDQFEKLKAMVHAPSQRRSG